ncbi:MAG TPA: 1-acyl-sn-glycerol-3-phosphate acyltransferase [Longimicrobium sp.]|uniref:1-acyl-sn-glycerol-3-phosphate acyltransferase n=1 Tax=Longimicrobium sp. TaxID=2029185 RepID=UPI002ED91EDB
MWLLPFFAHVSSLAVRTFYRLTVAGKQVPPAGPVLIVANHPNSLVDPAAVAAVAGRPVRFLAKAPLFTDPAVGWLVRGSGAIPVYRHADNPAEVGRNEDTFRAVHQALADGAAVGIFPEGVSHSEPSLVPLKTGAARIALGAAAILGGSFPVVAVGLTFRKKQQFRSEALVMVGKPVEWDDLAARGMDDREAVDQLTERIDRALHRVTLNLERWEDQPLVETAEAVYAAEFPVEASPAARVARLRETADGLARLRSEERGGWEQVASAVSSHARALRVLRMTPVELKASVGKVEAGKWVARQLGVLRALIPIAIVGIIIFYIPYRATGFAEARARPPQDIRATFKTLVGTVLHAVWTIVLAVAVWWRWGWKYGLAALVLLPILAWVTLWTVDMWNRARGEARRFYLRARRAEAIEDLRIRQRALAERLAALWETVKA